MFTNCQIEKVHVLLCIGRGRSVGTRYVYMRDLVVTDSGCRLFFAKAKDRSGGFIENSHMDNVTARTMQRVLEIETDVLYQWRNLVPTYEERITRIDGLYISNIDCERTEAIYDLKGNSKLPAKNVVMTNINVGAVTQLIGNAEKVENVSGSDIFVDGKKIELVLD